MTTGSHTTTSSVSRSRAYWLALGWLVWLGYLAWLIHNALPLLSGAPTPSHPDAIAQVIALPPALAVPGVSLPPLVATLAFAMFVVLVALTLNKAPTPQPTIHVEPAPVDAPTPLPASEPAPAPQAEEPAPEISPQAEDATEPATPIPDAPVDAGATPAIVAIEEAVVVEPATPAEPVTPTPVPPIQPARAPLQRQTTNSRRVFISSTSRDLVKHRKRLYEALKLFDDEPVGMEDFGASPVDATTVSLEELSTAKIVVLIVAWRYGFIPDGETRSVTELEYEAAKKLKLPVYVFLADPSTEADAGPDALFPAETRDTDEHAAQLAAFRARLSDPNSDVSQYFDTPDNLATNVLGAIGRRDGRAPVPARYALVKARELDLKSFSMGDDNAAKLPYQKAPVQVAWDTATAALANARDGVGGKRGIVTLGEASAGKTRLALEALIATLPDWPVLRWYESSTLDGLRAAGSLPKDGLVIFIDDLQRYPPATQRETGGRAITLTSNPAAILRELVESITGPVIIVATCRTEGEGAVRSEMTWLFDKLTPVTIPQFSDNQRDPAAQRVIASFAEEGVAHLEDWDGTIGSLVLGLSAKRAQYHTLVGRDRPAVEVLRAMKLLYTAGVYQHTERRVRAVCGQIFHHLVLAENARVWEEAYTELLNPQFVRIADDTDQESDDENDGITLVIRKDAYFDKVIDDYPNPRDPGQETRHLAELQRVFASLEDVDGLFLLAATYFERSDYSNTLAAYERALALNPEDASAWYNKGVALRAQGKTEEALAAFERALAINPEHAGAWVGKGVALGAQGKTEEALAAYERVLALNPKHASALVSKRVALRELGRWDEALTMYDEALARNPDDVQAWNGRGYVLLGLKHYDEAVASIDRALALEPENSDWWDSRGEILLNAGRYQEAIAAYDEALKRTPDLASSREGKAQALRALGRDAEADALGGSEA